MGAFYLCATFMPVFWTIQHTEMEVGEMSKVYGLNDIQNNGAVKEAAFWKELAKKHGFLGRIIQRFFGPTLDKEFHLPTRKKAQEKLYEIPHFEERERNKPT
jgi:hypothetical protein